MKAPSWSSSMLQGKFLLPKPIYSFTIRSELMRIRESQLAISALVETQGQLLVEQMDRLNQLEERLNNTTTMNNSNISVAQNTTSNSNSNISVAQNISTSSNSSQLIQNSTIVVSPSPTATASNSMASSSPSDNQAPSTSAN